jgi:hypothetical protein
VASYLGLGNSSNTQKVIKLSALQVSSSNMDAPLTLMWGQRRLGTQAGWYNNFKAKAVSAKGKGGGKGGGEYDYSAATILLLCEGPIDGVANVWPAGSTTTVTTLAKLGFTLFLGTTTQTPWSYVTTNYPTQARSYARTAYIANPKLDLGSSATIPDNGIEVIRSAGFSDLLTSNGWKNPTSGGITSAIDCSFADIIPDFLTNVQYGMGFSSSTIPDMTFFRSYQDAQGLYFSPCLTNQEKATDIINRWAQFANTWIYWDGSQFRFVPLGDSPLTRSSFTYTPDLDIAYNLTTANFIGTPPVKVTRADGADCYNRTVIEITDRTIGYISNPLEYKDQTLIDQYGLRDDSSTSADEICNPAVGAIVVQLMGKRAAYIRDVYSFKLPQNFIRLLPGSICTITEPNIGLNQVRVRIRTVSEDDNNELTFEAEEFPSGIGTYYAPNATSAPATPTYPDENIDPGSVNTPCVIEPNSAFTGGTPKVIIALSGAANWGGADTWLSFDGVNFDTMIGTITAPAAQGVLTGNLPSHADPDTSNTLAVNLAESQTTPAPVTTADADALRTLSYVSPQPVGNALSTAGELLAFGNVATTGTFTANLTYLRRGKYGTAPASHSIGDQFTALDLSGLSGTTIEYAIPPQYVGQTIYLKFASKNAFGNETQDLSLCTAYSYTPTGAGYGGGAGGIPTLPTGLAATAGVGQNLINWNANPSTDNVTSYTLYAAPGLSQPFSSAVAIYNGLSTAFTHSGIGNGANYTYFLKATNAMGTTTNTAGVNCTSAAAGSGTLSGIKKSGTVIDAAAQTLNFTGAGIASVTTDGSHNVTVTASGGSGSVPISVDGTLIDAAPASLNVNGTGGIAGSVDGSHNVTLTIAGTSLLVNGDTPGPVFIYDWRGQPVTVPLK